MKLIIFDTNTLWGLHRDTPEFDLLLALKHAGSQPAGIPWMVREELVAKKVLEYAGAYEKADTAIRVLNRKMPWTTQARLPSRETDKAKDYWRSMYAEVLTTLVTSGESARQALAREAYCEKPAKTDPNAKAGARDAAIWLSVVEYLTEHPEEKVYFVTDNYHDFGKGTDYPAEMLKDLGSMKDRITLMASFTDVLSLFTEAIPVDTKKVADLLAELPETTLAMVGSVAKATMKDRLFAGTRFGADATFEPWTWDRWFLSPSTLVRSVSTASGHKIGSREWYTATVEWLLVGYTTPASGWGLFRAHAASDLAKVVGAMKDSHPLINLLPQASLFPHEDRRSRVAKLLLTPPEPPALALTACTWRAKILFSPGAEQGLTVLASGPPAMIDPDHRKELLPVINMAAATQEKKLSDATEGLTTDIGPDNPPVSPSGMDSSDDGLDANN